MLGMIKMRLLRVTIVISVLNMYGCASLTKDCLSLAPSGQWRTISEPPSEIVELFWKSADNPKRKWFRNGNGHYALCYGCEDVSRRASFFEFLDPAEGKDGSGEIVVRNCGPY